MYNSQVRYNIIVIMLYLFCGGIYMTSKQKIALWISFISFFAINLIPTKIGIILDLIISVVVILVILKCCRSFDSTLRFIKKNKALAFLSGLISIVLGARFFYSWFSSSKLLAICFNNSLLKNLLLIGITVFLIFCCYYIINLLLQIIVNYLPNDNTIDNKSSEKPTVISVIIILLTSIICITICSKSSPIYPFNNWLDANCFFTVGKSITNNIVMYKDIFEQKGPLLYFLHTIAYFISHTTFIGVYIFEIISCFIFLFLSFKTINLFTNQKIVFTVPLFAAIIFSASALSNGGSAEEFCLPCIALCNYYGIKSIKNNTIISIKEWFFIGVTSGAVLWIKFSLLGFYIGFGLIFIFLYIKNKWFKGLFKSCVSLLSGVFIISLPILAYFIMNNAIYDLFEVYFYDNLFVYTVNGTGNKIYSLLENLYIGYSSFVKNYLLGFIFIIAGIVYLLKQKQQLLLYYYIITFLFSFLFIYSGGRNYRYYSFELSVYVPFGMLFLHYIFKHFNDKVSIDLFNKKYVIIPLCAILYLASVVFMFSFSSNTYMLKYSKDDFPQFKFDKIISQTESPTLLNYGFLDGGFYTVSDIMPTCKYFCRLNIPYSEIEEMQDYYVENGLTEYVVTCNKPLDNSKFNKYQCVSTAQFETGKDNYKTYYLYKKV